ncbi:hypothetical protein AB0O22_31890 [Streptomyces sp. NPDC091204]|uniref:hypothetical protein n=1 Tax=Streptomyces sp. NPDC091204 TaxID=3155299 RepID=UPI003449C564
MTDTLTETAAAPTTVPQEPSWPEALGARRLAGMLAETTGQPVTAADVEELVAREHLVAVDSYKGWPLYATAAARELNVDRPLRLSGVECKSSQISGHLIR